MTNEQNNNNSWLCYMIWAILGVILIMVFSFYIIYNNIGCWEKRGQFGDLFGAVNALFSGLAFAGLIITIRQQNKNLEYQQRAIDQ